MRIPLWIVFFAALVLATASSQASEEHFNLQRGKQTVYAMPNAPRMERFWLNATLDKSQGILSAVWGYEKGGGSGLEGKRPLCGANHHNTSVGLVFLTVG